MKRIRIPGAKRSLNATPIDVGCGEGASGGGAQAGRGEPDPDGEVDEAHDGAGLPRPNP